MLVEIKDYDSDKDDPWSFRPDLGDPFMITIGLKIGQRNSDRADDFQLVIANLSGLQVDLARNGCIFGRRLLIVDAFDWKILLKKLENTVRDCQRSDWTRTVGALRKYFNWEYEDHEAMNWS